jgi:hypothetical protein
MGIGVALWLIRADEAFVRSARSSPEGRSLASGAGSCYAARVETRSAPGASAEVRIKLGVEAVSASRKVVRPRRRSRTPHERRILVGRAGLEPATTGLKGQCSTD